jgi:hypothetical protein
MSRSAARLFGRAAQSLFAAAFHHLSAVVAEFIFLTGKTVENPSAPMFDAGAEPFGVGAAGAPMMTFLLGKRQGREGCTRNDDARGDDADHGLLPA